MEWKDCLSRYSMSKWTKKLAFRRLNGSLRSCSSFPSLRFAAHQMNFMVKDVIGGRLLLSAGCTSNLGILKVYYTRACRPKCECSVKKLHWSSSFLCRPRDRETRENQAQSLRLHPLAHPIRSPYPYQTCTYLSPNCRSLPNPARSMSSHWSVSTPWEAADEPGDRVTICRLFMGGVRVQEGAVWEPRLLHCWTASPIMMSPSSVSSCARSFSAKG